jgi:hypothetical protein
VPTSFWGANLAVVRAKRTNELQKVPHPSIKAPKFAEGDEKKPGNYAVTAAAPSDVLDILVALAGKIAGLFDFFPSSGHKAQVCAFTDRSFNPLDAATARHGPAP